LTKPDLETRNAETPPIPQMGPPPEVIFSDPAEGEIDVPLKAAVRLQFSRDMNPTTFKDKLRWDYVSPSAGGAATPAALGESARTPAFKYDPARRALELRLTLDDAASYRNVAIELLDGIAATDGAKLSPFRLTFTFAGQ